MPKRRLPIFLSAEIPGDKPPKEIRFWAYGWVKTLKGDFLFDEEAAQLVMAAYKDYGNELSFDYEHQAILGEGEAPAAGWFSLELREDGLWATDISWTKNATQRIEEREYRYYSPAFDYDRASRRITNIVNAALTNTPATKHLEPLVASRARDLRGKAVALGMSFSDVSRAIEEAVRERFGSEDAWAWVVEVYDDRAIFEWDGKLWQIGYRLEGSDVSLGEQAVEVKRTYAPVEEGDTNMKTLLKALGLKDDATEAEALAALTTIQGGSSQLVTLTGKATPAEALGVIQAWKAANDQVQTLSTRVKDLEGQTREAEVLGLIEQGKKDGKVTPAMEPVLTSMGKENVATLKAFLEAAPKVAPEGNHTPPNTPGPVTLSVEERAVLSLMGTDPAKYAEHKKAQQA